MEKVRLGVVGCGVIGQHHLTIARQASQVDVVAVADLREEVARTTAEKFGVERVYTDGEALLADPNVEAVVLAMPTRGRAELALSAFARSKHVLTEKPVAMNADEVRRLIQARGRLVAACCSSRFRFPPSARAAAEVIAGGALGELRMLHCRAIVAAGKPPEKPPPPWRLSKSMNGGGILVNWGCYDLDYLLGLTGWSLKPKQVLAQCWRVPPQFESHIAPGSDAETHFAAFIRCENGAVISIERGEYVSAESEGAWRIVGTRGALRLQMTPGEGRQIVHHDTTTEQGVISKTIWEGDEGYQTPNDGPVQDFAEAIREGREPETSLEKALAVQQITDAIYESAERGVAIEIH